MIKSKSIHPSDCICVSCENLRNKLKEVPVKNCSCCGVSMTKAEGGTIFTVCDSCWDKPQTKFPSKEAIEAAHERIDYSWGYEHDGDMARDQTLNALRSAYAIDFSALRSELQAAQRRIHDQNMEIMRLDDREELQELKHQLQAAQAQCYELKRINVEPGVSLGMFQDLKTQLAEQDEAERLRFALKLTGDQLAASQREVERLKAEIIDERQRQRRVREDLQAALDEAKKLLGTCQCNCHDVWSWDWS